MASNAWERAQEAIAHASRRATERDEDVITPDTAVSPFDASMTTVLPHATALGHRAGADPDLTQRLTQHNATGGTNGHREGTGGTDDDDANTVRIPAGRGPTHPGTSPFPASEVPVHGATSEPDPPRRPWWRRLFGG